MKCNFPGSDPVVLQGRVRPCLPDHELGQVPLDVLVASLHTEYKSFTHSALEWSLR
jgi:hypothetical protein